MNPYYDHNGITIYHGNVMDVVPLLDVTVNAVITSPPYNQMTSLQNKPSGMWASTDGGYGFVRKWQEQGSDLV